MADPSQRSAEACEGDDVPATPAAPSLELDDGGMETGGSLDISPDAEEGAPALIHPPLVLTPGTSEGRSSQGSSSDRAPAQFGRLLLGLERAGTKALGEPAGLSGQARAAAHSGREQ